MPLGIVMINSENSSCGKLFLTGWHTIEVLVLNEVKLFKMPKYSFNYEQYELFLRTKRPTRVIFNILSLAQFWEHDHRYEASGQDDTR